MLTSPRALASSRCRCTSLGRRFIVAAVNAAGVGNFSRPSNGVTTLVASKGQSATACPLPPANQSIVPHGCLRVCVVPTGESVAAVVGYGGGIENVVAAPVKVCLVAGVAALTCRRRDCRMHPSRCSRSTVFCSCRHVCAVQDSDLMTRAAVMAYTDSKRKQGHNVSAATLLDRSGVPVGVPEVAVESPPLGGSRGTAAAAAAPAVDGGGGGDSTASSAPPPRKRVDIVPCLGPVATVSDTSQTVTVHQPVEFTVDGWASHFSPRKYNVKAGECGVGGLLVEIWCHPSNSRSPCCPFLSLSLTHPRTLAHARACGRSVLSLAMIPIGVHVLHADRRDGCVAADHGEGCGEHQGLRAAHRVLRPRRHFPSRQGQRHEIAALHPSSLTVWVVA
jgi:hypothetical protein